MSIIKCFFPRTYSLKAANYFLLEKLYHTPPIFAYKFVFIETNNDIMIMTIIIIFRQSRIKSIQSRSGILKSSCFEKLEFFPEKIQKQSPGGVL